VQWKNRLTVTFLVQGKGELAVLNEVTAVLLQHIAMDKWTEDNVVSTG